MNCSEVIISAIIYGNRTLTRNDCKVMQAAEVKYSSSVVADTLRDCKMNDIAKGLDIFSMNKKIIEYRTRRRHAAARAFTPPIPFKGP